MNNMIKYAFGIRSTCEDNNHIFMSDIDENIKLSNIIDIVNEIQNKYFLHEIYIMRSTKGYNLFSLDKLPLKMIYKINKDYPSIDQQFNEIAYNTRQFYVLRIGADKEIITTLKGSTPPIYTQSNAHRVFFNGVFDLHIEYEPMYYDEYEKFWIIRFRSLNHGVEMDD